MLRVLVLASLAAACVPGVSDPGPRACTEIGCASGFRVDFPEAASATAGRYVVRVVADGRAATCAVTLPFPSCAEEAACEGDRSFLLGLSGCALPPAAHRLSGVEFVNATPAQVSVTLSRDGQTVAEGAFAPVYVESRPNGPGCDPVCRTAPAATLVIRP